MKTITDRIDRVTTIPATHLREDPLAPRSVKIELTSQCNYACQFCSLKDRPDTGKQSMTLDFFKRITREMREEGVEEIGMFFIGESFMAPKLLVDGIRYLKQELAMPYVFITTNGSLAHPKTVEACMEAGLDSIKWSCNAADVAQFSEVMAVNPRLMLASALNLKAARKIRDDLGYKCGIYASSIQYDGEQAEKMQAMLDRDVLPYVDQHYFLPLYGQMANNSAARSQELGFVPTAGNQGRVAKLVAPLPCWAVFTEAHVRVDGHLSACCFGADDKFDMGDLNTTSFSDAWNSPTFRNLRRFHLAKDVTGSVCENCIAY